MSTPLRPPDAGTTNEWSFVGGGKVYVWRTGLPTVLGREPRPVEPLVAVTAKEQGGAIITITAHQARALAEILLAAAEHADQDELCPACGNPAADGPHGMSEYGGCI